MFRFASLFCGLSLLFIGDYLEAIWNNRLGWGCHTLLVSPFTTWVVLKSEWLYKLRSLTGLFILRILSDFISWYFMARSSWRFQDFIYLWDFAFSSVSAWEPFGSHLNSPLSCNTVLKTVVVPATHHHSLSPGTRSAFQVDSEHRLSLNTTKHATIDLKKHLNLYPCF